MSKIGQLAFEIQQREYEESAINAPKDQKYTEFQWTKEELKNLPF